MNRPISLLTPLLLAIGAIHACGGNASSSTSSNTNWLQLCETQQDCGEGLSCECNVCQEVCTRSSDCEIAGVDSRCIAQPSELSCGMSNDPIRVCAKSCTVSSDCERNDLECANGACTPRISPIDAGEGNVLDATPLPATDAGAPIVSTGDAGPPLLTGTGYAVADSNFDPYLSFDTYAEFDDAGNLIGYSRAGGGSSDYADFAIGNAVPVDTGHSGGVTWGSWYGGPLQDSDNSFPTGWHYAVGKSAVTFPPGQVRYRLLGSTSATFREGTEQAQLEHASAVIDYDEDTIDFELRIAVPPTVRSFYWPNQQPGLIEVHSSERTLMHLSSNDGPERAVFDFIEITGIVVDEGNALVVGYTLRTSSQHDAGANEWDNWVSGALALQRE